MGQYKLFLFHGVLISGVALFQGCLYFRGVFISGYPYFRVSFQECPYCRGILIEGVPLGTVIISYFADIYIIIYIMHGHTSSNKIR